jgi:hypothetical protein
MTNYLIGPKQIQMHNTLYDPFEFEKHDLDHKRMPPKKNPWVTVLQYTLIILISACIAGTVGGVTSQIHIWSASSKAVEVDPVGKETVTVVRMVAREWHA